MITYKYFKEVADIKYGKRLKELHDLKSDLTLLECVKSDYLNTISHKFCPELLQYYQYCNNSTARKRYLDRYIFKKYVSLSNLTSFEIKQLRSFISLKCNSLPDLQNQINVLFAFLELQITDYKHALDIHNKEFGIGILRGYPMRLGRGLSKFQLKVNLRSKPVLDWFATKRAKQNLLLRGIPVYNKETSPLGENYFMYRTDNSYIYVQWSKKDCNIPNKRLYSFKVTNYIHTSDRTMGNTSKELVTNNDILYNDDLGILQKMNLLKERDSIINTIYKNGI